MSQGGVQSYGFEALLGAGGVEASNLAHVLNGHRKPSLLMLEKLRTCLAEGY
jgi:hypothetical protein